MRDFAQHGLRSLDFKSHRPFKLKTIRDGHQKLGDAVSGADSFTETGLLASPWRLALALWKNGSVHASGALMDVLAKSAVHLDGFF